MSDVVFKNGARRGERVFSSPFYVLRGALFIWAHRVLWKYAAAPLAISAVVLGVSYYLLYKFFVGTVSGFMGETWYWQVLYYFVVVIVAVIMLVVFFLLFTRVASALAAPFNELISEKTEQLVTGNFDDASFSVIQLIKDSGRGIYHSFKILGIYVLLLLAALILLVIPVIGAILFTVATVLLSSYMFAYEYLGYPMDRRRLPFKDKRSFLRSRLKTTMGFGLGNTAVASIPIVNLLFIPAAVVGGTLLFLELHSGDRESSSQAQSP